MEMGCHVFIEKPITQNIKEAKELVGIAKKKDLIIQVGHIERFNPAFYSLINKKFNLTINNSSDIEKLFLSYKL